MALDNFIAKNVDFDPDIVIKDKDDRPMMFVAVYGMRAFGSSELKVHGLENYQQVPFLMFVNITQLRIYRSGNYHPVMILNPGEIFPVYDPDYQNHEFIFQDYLVGLMDAWLSDLSFHWKSEHPPFETQINEIGLSDLLENGFLERIWEWD